MSIKNKTAELCAGFRDGFGGSFPSPRVTPTSPAPSSPMVTNEITMIPSGYVDNPKTKSSFPRAVIKKEAVAVLSLDDDTNKLVHIIEVSAASTHGRIKNNRMLESSFRTSQNDPGRFGNSTGVQDQRMSEINHTMSSQPVLAFQHQRGIPSSAANLNAIVPQIHYFGTNQNAFKSLQMCPDLYADFDIQRRRIAAEFNRVCREIRLAVHSCGADVAVKKHEIDTRIAIGRQKFQNLEQKMFEKYYRKTIASNVGSISASLAMNAEQMRKRKKRRENFQNVRLNWPEQVLILRSWLLLNLKHPYPGPSDKDELAKRAGLSYDQVSNWFVNARMRTCRPIMKRFEVSDEETKEEIISNKGSWIFSNSNNISLPDTAISEFLKNEEREEIEIDSIIEKKINDNAVDMSDFDEDMENNTISSALPRLCERIPLQNISPP
eukprot:499286_1